VGQEHVGLEAREIGTDNDPASFERAFERVVRPTREGAKPGVPKSGAK
jgi:hypothetical protein